MKECVLIGGAINIGQKKQGTERAPHWLRQLGLLKILNHKFQVVNDLGDFKEDQSFTQKTDLQSKLCSLSRYSKHFGEIIETHLKEDRFVLNLGGDHSLAVGSMTGSLSYNPNMKIIWVDAHADMNTPQTSPSMNTHGMPVALAMKHKDFKSYQDDFLFLPHLPAQNIVYIGLRDVDPGEQKILEDGDIKYYTAADVHEKGIETVMSESIHYLDPQKESEFHLSLDVDGIDPRYFPSTGTPVEMGLDLEQAQYIIKSLSKSGRLKVMDLVELNPHIGSELDVKISGENGLSLIESFQFPNELSDNSQVRYSQELPQLF